MRAPATIRALGQRSVGLDLRRGPLPGVVAGATSGAVDVTGQSSQRSPQTSGISSMVGYPVGDRVEGH